MSGAESLARGAVQGTGYIGDLIFGFQNELL